MTKISKKIGKMWKDMTGVSPIIAVILMVAITVVLAATIYVWVSGFGGSGSSTPAISCSPDNTKNKLTIVSADSGVAWKDINVSLSNSNYEYAIYINGGFINGSNETTSVGTAEVTAGDYILLYGHSGDNVDITLRYKPTNTIIGTWTVSV